ncbi:MAG: sodium:solute symporter family protein, partial [Victivallaceae bacterium]|nr:sodium:solute symporter family protein [Victivallaceae bacterium]
MTETIFQQLGLPNSMVTWLFIGIGVYMAGMLAIGFLSAKKVNNLKDYIVAGRRLPLWMATGTLLATWFGAGSSMGVAATVYQQGIIGVLADPFGASISLLLAGIFVVGILRKNKCLTVTDTIARKYGPGAGIYASLWMIPVYIGWLSAQFLGLGTILHVLTGLSVWKGTIIGAIVVLIYTYAGGMWAVTLTDIVQVSIIILGLMVIMPGAVSECGGLAALRSHLSDVDVAFIPASFSGAEDVTYYIGSWIIMGLGCMVGQDLVQRSLASRSPNVAISSSVISGFMYMAVGIIPITIGFAARIVFAKYGFTAAEIGADIDNQVLPRMAIIVLGKASPVLLVMFIAALVSAIMSSADSSLLAGTSLLVNNVICAFAGKENGKNKINGKAKLMLTRITTVVLSIISVVLALASSKIYTLMTSTWASQLVVVFIPVIASLYIP